MGSALARALQQAGHDITVWNRSPEKMQPFTANGVSGASSVLSAVSASPVILVCVDNYAVTQSLLGTDDVVSHLSGRILVQLSTGTPREAREASAWFNDREALYIDGAILVLPDSIGSDDAQILFAGPKAAFEQAESLLRCFGGGIRYLGENVRAAATLDLAFLCQRFGMILGAVHGVSLCESEEVGADVYAAMFPDGDRVRTLAQIIYANEYGNPGVTVQVWNEVLRRIQEQAHDAGINGEFPEFAAGILKRAVTAGHGEADVAALVKVLRGVQ